jgi:hypothetical protein
MLDVNLYLRRTKIVDVIVGLDLEGCRVDSEGLLSKKHASSHKQSDQKYCRAHHLRNDCPPTRSLQFEASEDEQAS